jgi:hypothetical protein
VSYDHRKLRQEVMDVIHQSLPECLVLEIHQMERRSAKRVTLPVLVWYRHAALPGDWGAGNIAYEQQMDFYYLTKWSDPGVEELANRLEALKDGLTTAPFTESGLTVLSDVELDTSPDNPANQIAMVKNLQLFGGMLRITAVYGATGR